jgi:hypothetical protein
VPGVIGATLVLAGLAPDLAAFLLALLQPDHRHPAPNHAGYAVPGTSPAAIAAEMASKRSRADSPVRAAHPSGMTNT